MDNVDTFDEMTPAQLDALLGAADLVTVAGGSRPVLLTEPYTGLRLSQTSHGGATLPHPAAVWTTGQVITVTA